LRRAQIFVTHGTKHESTRKRNRENREEGFTPRTARAEAALHAGVSVCRARRAAARGGARGAVSAARARFRGGARGGGETGEEKGEVDFVVAGRGAEEKGAEEEKGEEVIDVLLSYIL